MSGAGLYPIDERFVLEERVASGAFGEIHRGRDLVTGQQVAVKRLLQQQRDPVATERFHLEARLLARVESPYVVRYVAHGVDNAQRWCLVLEWLEGLDLSRCQRTEPLSAPDAVEVIRQSAIGLHAIHAAGIVHRDVKPSNIFVTRIPGGGIHARLIDLGIARADAESALTLDGFRIGTPAYMSPEQARGDAGVDRRSDVFSLGVVLYELLIGHRPFSGTDPYALLAKIVLQEVPRLRDSLPNILQEIDDVVARATAKRREGRYATALAFADGLTAVEALSGTTWSIDDDSATESVISESMVATGEIRVVTAIFVGIPSSETYANDVETFEDIALAHGSVVHRTLGRRAAAVFGIARSVGDEVQRAARAGLAVARRLPGATIAIATCRVVTGSAGLSGDAIERAHERLGDGNPGIVYVDDATAHMLESAFDVTGVAGSLHLRAEHENLPDSGPRLFGRTTTIVGRDRELAVLNATFDESREEPVARAVLLTGASGAGKSRVRFEFIRRALERSPDALVLLARGDSVGAGSPFGLLGSAIRRAAGVLEGEDPDVQRARLRALVGRAITSEHQSRVSAFLAAMISVPADEAMLECLRAVGHDAVVRGDAMRAAWEDWLLAECSRHPVILVLEDLQWGDVPTVRFVDAALRNLREEAFMVVALARPEVHEAFPQLWKGRDIQELRVGPLTRKACQKLVREVLGERVSEDEIGQLVDRCEGNPFHLEELLRATASGTRDALPESVLGMVQARLDALGPEAKRVLRVASVFGQTFWQGGVNALIGSNTSSDSARDWLGELVQREVILRRDAGKFPGETEYAFRHALVREAAYAMLPDSDKLLTHALAGAWLEGAGETDPMVLAEHFERGGELDRARTWYVRGAERALAGNDFEAAITRAHRARECGAAGDQLGLVRLVEAEAHRWRGAIEEFDHAAADALTHLEQGTPIWYRALGEALIASGRLGRAGHIERLVEIWQGVEPASAARAAAIACGARTAAMLAALGREELTDAVLTRVETLSRALPDLDRACVARIAQARGQRAMVRGELSAYLGFVEQAVAVFKQAGDERNACNQQINVGNVYLLVGLNARAEESVKSALLSADRMGLPSVSGFGFHILGLALARSGNTEAGREKELRALETFRAQGDRRMEAACLTYLAEIAQMSNDLVAAEREASLAVSLSEGFAAVRVQALAIHASVLLARGRVAEALERSREGLALMAEVREVEEGEPLVRLVNVQALLRAGDASSARAALAVARERILARAARIGDPALSEHFLTAVPAVVQTLALVREVLGDDIAGGT